MTIYNDRLSLNQGTIQKQDLRTRPSKYAQSNLRNWAFEQSEGVRPAEYMGVYKYLPVEFQDVNTEDWVVLQKGRIVSALGMNSTSPSGIPAPQGSGYIPIGISGDYMGTGTGATIVVSDDTSFFGYEEHIVNLLVPANGGSGTITRYYSADDVTAGTRVAGTFAAATASGAVSFAANIPIGVAFHDIYQDIRGKYLNYRMHPDGQHILTDWYVEVPFVNSVSTGDAATFSGVPLNASVNTWGRWRELNKQFTYLSFDSSSTNYSVIPGALICPDIQGNYSLQNKTTTMLAGANVAVSGFVSTQGIVTSQTVGKLIALDSRFPKDDLEDVLTYPRSGMPGSQTGGIIKNLFDFVYYCLYIGNGTAPTIEAIYNGIRSGVFGLARIQLHVS
ncbi:MAG: hypothetical protein M0R17_05450 [Candidatus Omnitrophica bacterium]|jgi:hypothetical protein|nr:hypothetical protein [Candidatus Omnitrophota bacterium]